MKISGYENGSYRIRQGWYGANRLGEEYELARLPVQPGQKWTKWRIPIDESSVFDEYAEVTRSLGGGGKGVGSASLTWVFSGLRPQMIDYLRNDAAFWNGEAAQKFTIMTWDRMNSWRVLWVWAEWQPASAGGEPGFKRGFRAWRVPMVVKSDAPEGCDITPTVSRDTSDPVPQSSNVVFTLGVSNEGDDVTFEDITLIADIPSEMTYVTASAGDWTLEYFEGGVWSGTITVPADVTRVRGTYDQALAAGDESPAFTITLNSGTTSGNIDLDLSASTTGDVDNSNDTLTETIEVAT